MATKLAIQAIQSVPTRSQQINGDALSAVHISGGASILVANGGAVASDRCALRSSLSSSTTDMSFLPPPPPGMPVHSPGMPPPPPGMPPVAQGDPSSSRLPPEVLALKSQKWI